MTTVSEAPVSDASARRVAPDASLRALEAEAGCEQTRHWTDAAGDFALFVAR